MNKLRKKRLVDTLMEAYVDWRDACLRVNDAYASWTSETGVRATVAFGFYMAALDHEEEAAGIYAGLVRRTTELLWPAYEPGESLHSLPREVGL
jgi:hypothetical protein